MTDESIETTGKPENPPAATPLAGVRSPACTVTGAANERGLECPHCGCRHVHVLHTRAAIGA